MGTLVQTATALLLSVAISLYYTWLLTLIVLGVMPFVIASAVLHFQIVSRTNHSNSGSISEARKVLTDPAPLSMCFSVLCPPLSWCT